MCDEGVLPKVSILRSNRIAHRETPSGGEALAPLSRAARLTGGSGPARMTTSWQPTTLVQCISVKPWLTYPGCDEPGGCHDLTLGRIYEMLGIDKDFGTLAKGKAADLLVLAKNPLDDITNMRSIDTVYLGGKKFE